jgi:Fe-S-cluster containining protein
MKRPHRASSPADVGADLEARRAQRLHTTTTLRSQRTPLQVIAIAENAVAVAESAVQAAMEREPPRRPLACAEGCAWCCHKMVGTAAPEVFRIAAYLRENLSAEMFEALREQVVRASEQRRALTADQRRRAALPCVLLRDNRCAAYPVRPLTCRGYNSSDARRCADSVSSVRQVEVPMYAPQQRLNTFVLDGLRAGLEESGLDGELLELVAALTIALETPNAESRWLAGEKVFAAARLP